MTKDEMIAKLCKAIDDKISQRLEEIGKTHPQLMEVPEQIEMKMKQDGESYEYSIWFGGEQIAKFTISSKMKGYTEIIIEISEITYYK